MDAVFWVYIVQILIIACLTLWLELRYMRKKSPIHVYITVYIGWFAAFIILATLPFDIYTSSNFDKDNSTDVFVRNFTIWNWKILYFITSSLTWVIFPLQMSYVIRGEFSRLRRWWKTFLANLISYLIFGILGAVILLGIYFLVNRNRKPEEKAGIIDVVYVLTTVYGLVLIVFLMSYGMVALPKSLWARSNYRSLINKKLCQISIIEEKLNDLRIDLCRNITALENLNAGSDMQPYLIVIRNEIEEFKQRNPRFEEE